MEAVLPLLLGVGCLILGWAVVTNRRGFADRVVESRINLMPGDEHAPLVIKAVGCGAVGVGLFGTVFGVIFLIFS
ncbi:hypothetical protein OHA74_54210 [Streptomyces phaeochromogenes]|uniref:hypothetical protein n=1 Tax=Streptomyces phaeochromogenes TaxID=1923 RepID=UPI002E2C008C|nr:hypothetical protein [Streptomyces phaeochromogenes]